MYIYHLHSYKQIGQEKDFNGEVIRFLLEDDIHAENNNLDFLDLIYGTASRYDLRSKIYPGFMTYRKWIELSKNYPSLILSINFDTHFWKYKNFCKKILEQFPRNKRIIVAAGNEVYEKRGSAEKVYQTAKEVHEAMQETQRIYPIAFWNQKIYTSGEKEALEKLLNDQRVKEICEYFAFQSLGTSNSKVDKYVKMAKSKGYKCLDIELGTTTRSYLEIKSKFDLDRSLGIKDVVIMCPNISGELANYSDIWKKYALSINGDEKDKYKIINYAKQFLEKEEEQMKLKKVYKKWSRGLPIKFVQKAINEYFMYNCEGVDPKPDWYPLDVDGIFGPLTEKAIKWYQEIESLEQQLGVVDEQTMESLVVNSSQVWSWFALRWAYGER